MGLWCPYHFSTVNEPKRRFLESLSTILISFSLEVHITGTLSILQFGINFGTKNDHFGDSSLGSIRHRFEDWVPLELYEIVGVVFCLCHKPWTFTTRRRCLRIFITLTETLVFQSSSTFLNFFVFSLSDLGGVG